MHQQDEITGGTRSVPIAQFYLLPGSTPNRENVLREGEIITIILTPRSMGMAREGLAKLD